METQIMWWYILIKFITMFTVLETKYEPCIWDLTVFNKGNFLLPPDLFSISSFTLTLLFQILIFVLIIFMFVLILFKRTWVTDSINMCVFIFKYHVGCIYHKNYTLAINLSQSKIEWQCCVHCVCFNTKPFHCTMLI